MADKKLPYDPKLKEAIKKIRKILQRYDIGGYITLHSENHCEFLNHLEASWSVAAHQFENGKYVGVRFRSKREDFTSKEEQDLNTQSTVAMLLSGKDMAALQFKQLDKIETELRQHMIIDHPDFNLDDIYTGDGEETKT